jgi:hypothetical protein
LSRQVGTGILEGEKGGEVIMGWELRRGKQVYYRKVREADGRVRSIYCGSGERREQAAREDEERRAVRVAHTQKVPQTATSADATIQPPQPITLEEIVARGVAFLPVSLRESRGSLLHEAIKCGMLDLVLSFAKISDSEVERRGLSIS